MIHVRGQKRGSSGWFPRFDRAAVGGIGAFCLLVAAVLAAHSGALGGKFHYDDATAVVENPAIRSWQPLFYLTSPLAVSRGVDGFGYRPLTVATFAFNYALGRLDPWGYLAVNLLLHFGISWTVFVLGRRLLGDDRWAAVAALIYAIHPVNAEAVNYVVARSSLLATLGALAAFWAFIRRQEGGGVGWLVGGGLAFAAALLSKESAVALIPPLLMSSLVLGGARVRNVRAAPRLLREALWFVGLAAVFVAVRLAVAGVGVPEGRGAAYPLWAFAEMVVKSLGLWVWPWPLEADHPLEFAVRFHGGLAVGLVVLTVGATTLVVWSRARAPLAVWGAIWVVSGFLPLAPLFWLTTRGLLQENRLAFSAVGLAWLTAWAARAVWERVESRAGKVARRAALVVCAALGIALVVADRGRSEVWHDDRRLWEEVLRDAPENVTAHVNLGIAYVEAGDLDRAEAVLEDGVRLAPAYARLHYNLALVFLRRNQYEAARAAFLKTISLNPVYAEAYRALAIVDLAQGNLGEARSALERAVAINPRDGKAYGQLGLVAQRAGDQTAAERAYLDALRYDPLNSAVHNNLGVMYLDREEWSRALEHFTAAVHSDPQYDEAAYNGAIALGRLGRTEEARAALSALLPRLSADPKLESHLTAARAGLDADGVGTTPGAPGGGESGGVPDRYGKSP